MVWLCGPYVVKNGHHKDSCHDEIELVDYFQNNNTVLGQQLINLFWHSKER